jgi:hypothetical protein
MPDFTPTPQIQPEELPGRAFPRLPDELPNGTQQLGADIQGAGAILSQHAQAAEAMAQRTQFAQADNAIQQVSLTLTHDPQNGALTKEGQNAFNLGAQYLPAFDQAVQPIIDSTPDPRVREQLQMAAAQHRTNLMSQLDAHEIEQHKQLALSTSNASVNLAQQAAAANYNNPDVIAGNVAKVDGALSMRADNEGWSPEVFQQAQHQEHVKLYAGVIGNAVADGQMTLASHFLDSVKGELTPEELKTAQGQIDAGTVKSAADSIIAGYKMGADAGAQRLQALDASGLSQDDQTKVIQEVEHQRDALMYQRRQDPKVQAQLMTLEQSIATGKPILGAEGMTDALWQRGALTDEMHLSIRDQIARINSKNEDDAATQALYQRAYVSSVPLDPGNKDDKEGVDNLFQRMTAGNKPGTPGWSNRAVDITSRTGVVPESAVHWATANLVSGQPQDAASAADLIARVGETNPRSAEYIDAKTKAMATTISNAVRAGTDPQVAVEMARRNTQITDTQGNALDEHWKTAKLDQSQGSALLSRLKGDPNFKPGWFTGVPQVPVAMQSEYDQLTRDYYRRTGGDIASARDLAASDLRHVWGVSDVNGTRQIMPYAPEAMFPGLTAQDVRDDLTKTVASNAQLAGTDASKVQLIEDPQRTSRTHGQEWNLQAPDKNGLLQILQGKDGNPLVYQLPVASNDFQATRDRQARVLIEKAQADRAQRTRTLQFIDQEEQGEP